MRSRRTAQEEVAAVARRRLELLSAELAGIRPEPVRAAPVATPARDGPGEPPSDPADDRWAEPPGPLPDPFVDPIRSSPAHPEPERGVPEAGRHAHRSVGPLASLAGWGHDRLPPTLQGRVRLSPVHLTVLALLVAAALGMTAWWVARADDPGVPVGQDAAPAGALVTPAAAASTGAPAPAAGAAAATPSGSSTAAGGAASPAGTVVVDVAGKVRRPGIATLPTGSRVVDALEAAGGARRGVALTGLNLARVLVDGEQVVVGVPAPPGVAASAAAAPGGASSSGGGPMVSLNTASQGELEELPGVGPVTAQKILAYRSDNGAFTSVDQLLEVSGIGDKTLAEIAPFVTL